MVEQKWRLVGSFLGRTAEAIMITDAGARIVYVNQSFTKVTGYTLMDVAGMTPRAGRLTWINSGLSGVRDNGTLCQRCASNRRPARPALLCRAGRCADAVCCRSCRAAWASGSRRTA